MSGTGWRLYSVHCDCVRQESMRSLLSFMEGLESRGEYATPADYGEATGAKSRYRIFYAAEREGFIRQLLVRKVRGSGRRGRVYVLLDRGREWLREHERFLELLRAPDVRDARRPRPGPCRNMAPVKQFGLRVKANRAAALARARAKAEARLAAAKPEKRRDKRFGHRRRG